MSFYDVIIVGTRCAGAPLAMLLARRGYRVLGLDRARFPSDTLSTHFLFPRATHFLESWRLLDQLASTGCPRIDAVTFHYGSAVLHGRPDPVDGTSAMYCPRRTILDQLLVEAAREAGAEIRESLVVRGLLRDRERVAGVRAVGADGRSFEERATVVVGADGAFSSIARLLGAETEIRVPPLTCGYYAYWQDVPTEGAEFYLRDGRVVLAFPTHEDLTCIWAGRTGAEWSDYRADVESCYLAGLDPELLARVNGGRRVASFRGTGKLPNFYRRATGDGWALVGDAAYHRDPLTGLGIGDAFLGATLLADALARVLESGSASVLFRYQRDLREQTKALFEYTVRAAALNDPQPWSRLYEQIAASPEATRQFMNVLAGTLTAREFFGSEIIRTMVSHLAAPPHSSGTL